MATKSTSGASVPVLLMNPEERMATRKKKTAPARTSNPRRRKRAPSRRKGAPRRRSRARRRRNPSMDLPGLGIAAGVGVVTAGINYGLEGTNLTNTMQGVAMGAGGLAAGLALSYVSPAAAKAAVSAGVAFGGYKLIKAMIAAKGSGASETTTTGLGAFRPRLRPTVDPRTRQPAAMLSAVGATIGGRDRMLHPSMGAVGAPLPSSMRYPRAA